MSLDLQCPLCGKAGIPSEYIYWIHVHRAHFRHFRYIRLAKRSLRRSLLPCPYCGRRINLSIGRWIQDRLRLYHAKCWFKQALERQLAK